eukprot:1372016-Rhodomonas_salina.2
MSAPEIAYCARRKATWHSDATGGRHRSARSRLRSGICDGFPTSLNATMSRSAENPRAHATVIVRP